MWTGGRADGRTGMWLPQFLGSALSDAQKTKFSYPWCSAIIFNHVYIIGNRVKSNFFNLNIKDSWIIEKKFQAEVYYFPPTGKTLGKRSGDDSFFCRSRKKLQPLNSWKHSHCFRLARPLYWPQVQKQLRKRMSCLDSSQLRRSKNKQWLLFILLLRRSGNSKLCPV